MQGSKLWAYDKTWSLEFVKWTQRRRKSYKPIMLQSSISINGIIFWYQSFILVSKLKWTRYSPKDWNEHLVSLNEKVLLSPISIYSYALEGIAKNILCQEMEFRAREWSQGNPSATNVALLEEMRNIQAQLESMENSQHIGTNIGDVSDRHYKENTL